MEIKPLENIEFKTLYLAFSEAFKDYDIQLTKNELFTMLQRRGFVPELSFGAFDNGKLVAFTFNGIGFYNGIKTAYDTGTGTIDVYRGKGLATRIFEFSTLFLSKNGVRNYLLEVLQHNKKAVNVYKNLGFKVSREFNYFFQDIKKIMLPQSKLSLNYRINLIDSFDFKEMESFMDFNPSWQNSFDSIGRNSEGFKILGAFKENELIGFCILEPKTGDITQIAVDKPHRRKGIASQLVKEIIKYNKHTSLKIINTPIDCDSITKFLKSMNISIAGKQFEMIKKI